MSSLKPVRIAGLGVPVLLLLLLPIWPDFQVGSFVLEPERQASVHAPIRGRVALVFVDEGQWVELGHPLATLENLDLESELAKVRADLQVASARSSQSKMRYGTSATVEHERLRLQQEEQILSEKAARLRLLSPIDGVVSTPRVHDLQGAYLDEGAPVVNLIDDSALVARIYIPEFAMHEIWVGTPVRLEFRSRLLPLSGTLNRISADWAPLDPSLAEKEQLTGIGLPHFYMGEVRVDRSADLRAGMKGIAKLRTGRRSLASLGLRFVRDLVSRRVW